MRKSEPGCRWTPGACSASDRPAGPKSHRRPGSSAAHSSFFWLGLVVALFIGLFLTVFRTRNARRAAARHAEPEPRAPMVRPELWEVNVAQQAVLGGADSVARKWEELLVRICVCCRQYLADRTIAHGCASGITRRISRYTTKASQSISMVRFYMSPLFSSGSYKRSPIRRKWRMRRHLRNTQANDPEAPASESEPPQIPEAEVAMLILLPSPRAKHRYSTSSTDTTDLSIPEYALGTIGYRMDVS